jgi:hypothetical protein
MSFKTVAYIHSLKDKKTDTNVLAEAEILEHISDNNVIAKYQGVKCRAIYNGFVCRYFVDDLYGIIEDTLKNPEEHKLL